MAKGKDKRESATAAEEQAASKVEEVPEIPPDVKHIRVTLKGYMNITPTFSVSDLTVQAKHMENDLGVSSKTHVIDDDYIPTNHEFIIECDINSSKDLDQLISYPVVLSLFESVGEIDKELLEKLGSAPKPNAQEALLPAMSAESAADLSDAFTGKTMDRSMFISPEASEEPSRKGSKKEAEKSKSDTSKKNKKDSKTKLEKVNEKPSEMEFPTEPTLMGTTTLDLLPLFQGHVQISESLLVHQIQKVYDDRIIPTNIMPRVVIQVDILEDTWIPDDPNFNIFSLTVESIYNIPTLMSPEMQYKVSTFLPSAFAKWEYVVISGGKAADKIDMEKIKRWPGMLENSSLTGATKYSIDDSLETVKNNIEVNLEVINSEEPRIEWNIIKRNFMREEAVREFLKRLKKYRHLPLEVYVTSAEDTLSVGFMSPGRGSKADAKSKTKSDVSIKSDKGKKGKGGEKGGKKEIEDYLHLMTAADVSTLLYPGVNKCRIACPLNTYHEIEILQQTGQDNSYFMPKEEECLPSPGKGNEDKKKGGGKSDKGSESGKGSKKGDKGAAKDSSKNDLKPLLPPPPPPPPEPSTPVYNENGQRTFILIEIELLKPLSPKREIEDLSQELSQLLPKKPEMSKIVVSSRLANLYFKDVIKQLTLDLIHQHQHYLKEKQFCKCERAEGGDSQTAFLTFLQRSGVYHTYLMSVTKAASVTVNDKFPYIGEFNRNSKEYQNFIAEVYSSLIKETNGVLNELTSSGAEPGPKTPVVGVDPLLMYAKEASAIGANLLADRYYLERICRDHRNADYWFDYAVFQMEVGDKEKALECTKQCLILNDRHHYSLLLSGILFTEKQQYEEAETCFLSAVLQKNNWLEGWASMHLFYSQIGNKEGSDLCLEMANKFLSEFHSETDYFNSTDDLAWTTSICPNTVFFRTSVLLLKMRAFAYAEKALAHEVIKEPGICHYYLAVIMYYRGNYPHALIHLRDTERLHGSDYGVASLTGHCYLALRNLKKAKEQYLQVLESFDRPDDVHLLYIYLAVVWDRLGEKQSARKSLLLACKFSPTPYTWLTAGILFYGQKDLLSAEQCLVQANLCDNRLPEIWGYLALINLELYRYSEAQLCYKQAKKNKIRDEDLERKIHEAMNSLMRKENCTTLK